MKSKTLSVKILTADNCLYDGPADAAFLPGTVSPFEVLPGHAALISTLGAGHLKVMLDGAEKFSVKVSSGVVRVLDDNITVCAEI